MKAVYDDVAFARWPKGYGGGVSGITLYGVDIITHDFDNYTDCQICGAEWWHASNGNSKGLVHQPWCDRMVKTLIKEECVRLTAIFNRVIKRTKARWV